MQANMVGQANLSHTATPQRKEFRICTGEGQLLRIAALEMSIDGDIVKLADADRNGNWTIIFAGHLHNVHVYTESTQNKEGD